jgi:hypothetical protein
LIEVGLGSLSPAAGLGSALAVEQAGGAVEVLLGMIPIDNLDRLRGVVLAQIPNPGGGVTHTGGVRRGGQLTAPGFGPQLAPELLRPAQVGDIATLLGVRDFAGLAREFIPSGFQANLVDL